MEKRITSLLAVIAIIGLLSSTFFFTIKEYEVGIKFQLGEFQGEPLTPGLHWKIPFLNNVRTFDTRIQTLDYPPEVYLTTNNRQLLVDSFIKWRIKDVKKYFVAVRTTKEANSKLAQFSNDDLRNEVGDRTVSEVVSGERRVIMDSVLQSMRESAESIGVEVVDVRFKRVDYSDDIRQAVFKDMESERNISVQEKESTGRKVAEEIKAKADATALVTVAQAQKKATILRGEGDAKAANIYATAYSKDKKFYALIRSLEAYKKTFNQDKLMIIQPDSEFFEFFNQTTSAK